MSKAEGCYARAARCRSLADETIDPHFKRDLAQLAEKWFDLAEQEEADEPLNWREHRGHGGVRLPYEP